MAEQRLSVDDLIWPLFVHEGQRRREPIASMPGVDRLSIDLLVDAVGSAVELGIPAVALFPATDPAKKSADAAEAVNSENLVCRAVRAVKQAHGDTIGADVRPGPSFVLPVSLLHVMGAFVDPNGLGARDKAAKGHEGGDG